MLTPKMGGIFDCRAYDQSGKLAHDQRKMLADTDNVTFSALIPIDQVPDMFKPGGQLDEYAKPKSSKKEREAAKAENREAVLDVVSLKFKIGANARWFNKNAKPMQRPTNAELEANRYNVQIDFTRKAKDVSNPFSGQAFEEEGGYDDTDHDANTKDGALPGALTVPGAQQPVAAAPQVNQDGAQEAGDDLPF